MSIKRAEQIDCSLLDLHFRNATNYSLSRTDTHTHTMNEELDSNQAECSAFDYEGLLENNISYISEILTERIENDIEFYLMLEVYMKLPFDDSPILTTFCSSPSSLFEDDDIEAEIREHNSQIVVDIEDYSTDDFGWMVERVKMLYLTIIEYNPLIEKIINVLPFAKDETKVRSTNVGIMHPAPENIQFKGFINNDNTLE